ncbi:MAG: protein-export chaperone SecB [Holosporales bacterium]|jgi:preprotein translocase subunit SecB|nr:protein-export chaperone SecB [Holosporales bacterium]
MSENAEKTETGSLFTIPFQYLVDLSLENPNPLLHITSTSSDKPEISINVQVNARHLTERMFEVVLDVNANATRGKDKMFICQVKYAGIIAIDEKVEEGQYRNILLENCPAFLFPFARNIVATATLDTGFPPLLLQPVDFKELNKTKGEAKEVDQQIH